MLLSTADGNAVVQSLLEEEVELAWPVSVLHFVNVLLE